jgi:hypothetical protein
MAIEFLTIEQRRSHGCFNGYPEKVLPFIDKHMNKHRRRQKLAWNAAFNEKAVVVPDAGPLPKVKLDGGMELTLLSPSMDKFRKLRSYWVKDLKGKLNPGDEKAALELLAEDKKYAIDALGRPLMLKN